MDTTEYAGKKYHIGADGYFRRGSKTRGDYERLHRRIYEDHHGPIPEGWHVHHRDGDKLNNDPANLEAVPADQHTSMYHPEALEKARKAAADWHGSEEGRKWHSEHAADTFAARIWSITCDQCGKRVERNCLRKPRFCGNACRSASRRASGLDSEVRQCAGCGKSITVNRYTRTRFCSCWCGRRAAARPGSGVQSDG